MVGLDVRVHTLHHTNEFTTSRNSQLVNKLNVHSTYSPWLTAMSSHGCVSLNLQCVSKLWKILVWGCLCHHQWW